MTRPNGHPAFTLDGLTKRYPAFTLGPVTLSLDAGLVLALVGPNGAGKTTLINCIVGLARRDGGEVAVFGRPNLPNRTDWKRDIGYVGELKGFYPDWSAARNLAFVREYYQTWDEALVARLVARFALPLEKRVNQLSTGNRAKLALVAALGHRPRLLLLDEPFSGLDPLVRAEALDTLWESLEDGSTAILYSTHILSDIARLADEVAFLVDGRLVLRQSRDGLAEAWRRITFGASRSLDDLPGVHRHQTDGRVQQVVSVDAERTLAALHAAGAQQIEAARMTLDEIAVEIMKGESWKISSKAS